jgi:hypothetical protein
MKLKHQSSVALSCLLAAVAAAQGSAPDTQKQDDKANPKDGKYELGFQSTVIGQTLLPFHSSYAGVRSLPSALETRWTDTYTLFLGARIAPNFDLYVDPEDALGSGLGNASGLAGFPNAEVVRIGVREVPYWARYFGRWTIPAEHGGGTVEMPAGENQIPGKRPGNAVILTGGALSVGDIFDKNAYANSARTQFMNWALVNAASYDYAADVRGYSEGVAVEWAHPNWTLRAGEFEMPKKANGPDLSGDLSDNREEVSEFEAHVSILKKKGPSVFRLLAYRNLAHMGSYNDALAAAATTGTSPDIISVEKQGAVKYGFGLNFEQPLADEGDTGVFGRLGWNNGQTESYAYTECDQTVSLGLQVSGKKWKTPDDLWAVAVCDDGLSAAHREYLAAGGNGFQLGDGRLNYGQERIFETYYSHKFGDACQAALDFQLINNPGYNKDRGPVPVLSWRVHFEF